MMTTRFLGVLIAVATISIYACAGSKGTGGGPGTGGGTTMGGSGAGGQGLGTGGSGAGGRGSGTGGSGTVGNGGGGSGALGGMTGSGTAGSGSTGSGGVGVAGCTPGMPLITDCGYPSMSTTSPLTSVVFNESETLRGVVPSGGAPVAIVRAFYNDEHALTLGVRQVVVMTAAGGTTMTDYPVSPLATDPGSVTNPKTGTNMLIGDQSGLDISLRPMWPALFITDITANPNSTVGDWQQGGVPTNPTDVFGSWKAAVRTVDKTVMPNAVSIIPDADPAKNHWDLGPGGDPVPAGLVDQGWGAEARWSVPLASGHSYRLQVMMHDGDQRKVGGDSGEACIIFCAQGTGGAGGAGGYTPPPMCPAGTRSCGGGIDPTPCPAGTVCANGCCLPVVP
jgi:hypothetical protein